VLIEIKQFLGRVTGCNKMTAEERTYTKSSPNTTRFQRSVSLYPHLLEGQTSVEING
jgi:hypothetical protein